MNLIHGYTCSTLLLIGLYQCLVPSRATTSPPASFSVRFQSSGSGSHYGTIEVYQTGVWKNLCRDGFDNNEATVVCKQMGFVGGRLWRNLPGTQDIDTMIYQCKGSESDLAQCTRISGPSVKNCSHSQDVAVDCYNADDDPDPTLREKIVRIVGGSAHDETPIGTVEVLTVGAWRPVCPDGWSDADACTVCHQLGYKGSACRAESVYGLSSGYDPFFTSPTVMEIDCDGTIKDNITLCDTGMLYCTSHISPNQAKHAGVRCAEPSNLEYRLAVDGNTYGLSYGTIEVYVAANRYWHPVCDDGATDSAFYNRSANDVCTSLGYNAGVAAFGSLYGWSRAQGAVHHAPVREMDEDGAVMYGSCGAENHLGALCYQRPEDIHHTVTVKPKPKSATKDPYYDQNFRHPEEKKTSTESLVMYLGIAGAIMGLVLLGCYLVHRMKCCKRRRETAAAASQPSHPPVVMAKRGPVPGMVIIPSRNPTNNGAPPHSHVSTHVNQAFNAQLLGDPLCADSGPMRPSDEAYFQTGPGLAPVPPVYHGQKQAAEWSGNMAPVNSPNPVPPAGHGPGLPTVPPLPVPAAMPPTALPPAAVHRPPAYDSLYPKGMGAETLPAPAETLPAQPPAQEDGAQDGQDALNHDIDELLRPKPPAQTAFGNHPAQSVMENPADDFPRKQPEVGMDSGSWPGDGSATGMDTSGNAAQSSQQNAYPPTQNLAMEREKTLGMEDLERMLLPDTPVPPQ